MFQLYIGTVCLMSFVTSNYVLIWSANVLNWRDRYKPASKQWSNCNLCRIKRNVLFMNSKVSLDRETKPKICFPHSLCFLNERVPQSSGCWPIYIYLSQGLLVTLAVLTCSGGVCMSWTTWFSNLALQNSCNYTRLGNSVKH